MNLRDKIAGQLLPLLSDALRAHGAAERILAIPEIAEALAEKRLNAMPPNQFAAMLLDNLPKRG